MKLLIDMNLAPLWVEMFQQHGCEAVHWSEVGDPRASDGTIMAWARDNGYLVFTHDLDFGRCLPQQGPEGRALSKSALEM